MNYTKASTVYATIIHFTLTLSKNHKCVEAKPPSYEGRTENH
jgi:hypothetical protein